MTTNDVPPPIPAPPPTPPSVPGHWARPEFWLGLLATAITLVLTSQMVKDPTVQSVLLIVSALLQAAGIKAASTSVNQAKDAPSEVQAAHIERLSAENAMLKKAT